MGCQCRWSYPANSGANLRRYFLAPAPLAESMQRKLEPSRTSLSAYDRSGNHHDFPDLVCRLLLEKKKFAFAQAASRIGKNCTERSHQARERSEDPALSGFFQRSAASP